MPYTYRSISPDTRIRNGKDFHSPIKSRNFVLTVYLDGVRSPSSVSYDISSYSSQPRDRTRLYRDFRTQIPGVPVYLASLHFRHEVLHRERAALTCQPSFRHVRRERLAAGFANREGFCEVPQSSLGGSDDPCFSARRRIFRTEIKRAFHIRTERIATIRSRHFVSPVAVTRLQLFRM